MILIVEDDPHMAKVLRGYVERGGWQSHVVDTGEAALTELLARPYDLALVDINLPGMSGIEVAARAHEAGCDVPLVAVTGGPVEGKSDQPAGDHFDCVLLKPLLARELIQIVQECLSPGEPT